jgi:hypothetical protein
MRGPRIGAQAGRMPPTSTTPDPASDNRRRGRNSTSIASHPAPMPIGEDPGDAPRNIIDTMLCFPALAQRAVTMVVVMS